MQKGILIFVLLAISFPAITHGYNGGNSDYPPTGDNNFTASSHGNLFEIPDETKTHLAYTYAPVLWFYKDSLWEEPFSLIEAEYFMNVSHTISGNYKLIEDGYSGAKTLQSQYQGIQNPVYIRITPDEYQGNNYIVIQYWFHYLYNYGGALSLLNVDHEGEWEMIEVILEYDESILNGTAYPEPYLVAYSRHSGGETHRWENEAVEKEANSYHPVAYIAYGTHAAYFQDLGWNEDLNKGINVSYDGMNFISIDNKEWSKFPGRWGGQENSPVGPMFQESKWDSPVLWAMEYLDTFQLHLERPGHLLVTNEEGQRIGIVEGEYVNEIQNAYAVITEDHEYYQLPADEYSVEISAFDSDIDYDVVMNKDGEVTHMSYKDEVASHITKAYAEISEGLKEYALKMDKDGDGRIDLILEPEQIIGYSDKGKYPLFYLFLGGIILLVAFITYKTQKRIVKIFKTKPKRTRLNMAGYILKGVAAVFFLLWLIAVMTDLLGEYQYEMQFLQCAVGVYLGSQILPAFKKQPAGRKIQVFFINVGWPLIGLWAAFMILRWAGWFGPMEIGIDIDFFLVTGVIFLLVGYVIKFLRFLREHLIVGILFFVIGCVSIFFWIFNKVLDIFPDYADYILIIGIVAIAIGILGRLKRGSPAETEKEP